MLPPLYGRESAERSTGVLMCWVEPHQREMLMLMQLWLMWVLVLIQRSSHQALQQHHYVLFLPDHLMWHRHHQMHHEHELLEHLQWLYHGHPRRYCSRQQSAAPCAAPSPHLPPASLCASQQQAYPVLDALGLLALLALLVLLALPLTILVVVLNLRRLHPPRHCAAHRVR